MTAQSLRKSPSGINVLVNPWAGLMVPEDYLEGDETVASVTAAGTWEVQWNRMLADALVCGATAGVDYPCSAPIVPRSGTTVYGNQAEVTYKVGSADHNGIDLDTLTDIKIFGLKIDGGNQATGTYTAGNCIAVTNTSRVRIEGCTLTEFGNDAGTIQAGVLLYGNSYDVTVNDCDISRVDSTGGRAGGVIAASNHAAHSRLVVTNCRIWGGTDDTDLSGLYQGIDTLGASSNFILYGNEIRQCGHGMGIGYGGSAVEFGAVISNNVVYNCSLQGIYSTGGTPAGTAILIEGNVFIYCGGGDTLIGRATIWLGDGKQNVNGNIILHNGYTVAGAARGYSLGAIYNPQTANGISGVITGNVIIDSHYIGIGIDAPVGLVISDNYVESQYPIAQSCSIAGATLSLTLTDNVCVRKAGTVGDGIELSGVAGSPLGNVLCTDNVIINGTSGGSTGILVGIQVTGGLIASNSIKSCATGVKAVTTSAEYLGLGLTIGGNRIESATDAVLVSAIGGGTTPVFIHPNDYVSCTNQVSATGAGAPRVYEAYMTFPRRMVIGSAAPTGGTWRVGDKVINTVLSGTIVEWCCSVAGTPGTWVTVRSS